MQYHDSRKCPGFSFVAMLRDIFLFVSNDPAHNAATEQTGAPLCPGERTP